MSPRRAPADKPSGAGGGFLAGGRGPRRQRAHQGSRPIRRRRCRTMGGANSPASARPKRWPTGFPRRSSARQLSWATGSAGPAAVPLDCPIWNPHGAGCPPPPLLGDPCRRLGPTADPRRRAWQAAAAPRKGRIARPAGLLLRGLRTESDVQRTGTDHRRGAIAARCG